MAKAGCRWVDSKWKAVREEMEAMQIHDTLHIPLEDNHVNSLRTLVKRVEAAKNIVLRTVTGVTRMYIIRIEDDYTRRVRAKSNV